MNKIDCQQVEAVVFDLAGTLVFYQANQADHSQTEMVLFPGVTGLLKKIENSRYRLGLLSNSPGLTARYELKKLSIDGYFSSLTFADEVGFSKPDKRIFLAACGSLGLSPTKILMVGDSMSKDIYPAMELGMQVFLLEVEQHEQQLKKLEKLLEIST
ncbi:MAG: HAD family hydrolase [Patescibacteria group bacterium]